MPYFFIFVANQFNHSLSYNNNTYNFILSTFGMHKRQETQTTNNQQQHFALFTDIVTNQKDRSLFNARQGIISLYDGVDFTPLYNIGITSNLIHVSDDEQITYISGNHYCIASTLSNNHKMECFERKSENGQIKKIFLRKTKKINLISSVEFVRKTQQKDSFASIHVYNKITTRHNKIIIPTNGNILDLYILSEGKLGLLLTDETVSKIPKFTLNLFDIEKQLNIVRYQKAMQAIKLVSSNFGDFALVITKNILLEIELDTYNNKVQFSQFELKKYLEPDEICIDANFLKNTIKLVLVTNKCHILFFEGRSLVSKKKMQFPIKSIPSFEELALHEQIIQEKNQYQILSTPRLLQTSQSQAIIVFNDKKIGVLQFEGKGFNFESKYELPFKDNERQIQNFKFVNGDAYILFNSKNIYEMWILTRKGNLQQNIKICQTINGFPYISPPSLISVDFCLTNKLIYTIHQDKTLRIWNYENNLLFSKSFFQNPTGIAIHPFGFHLVISFKEFTKIFLIKQSDIQQIYTIKLKNISVINYEKLGNRIALVENQMVYILQAYNFSTIVSFPVQISNINQIKFMGQKICLSNDNQSMIYTLNGKKFFQRKSTCFQINKQEYVYCDDKIVRYKHENENQKEFILKQVSNNQNIKNIKIIPLLGIILFGTSQGNLLEFHWPFIAEQNQQPICYKYKAANSSIFRIHSEETYKNIIIVTQNTLILTLKINQYIDGNLTSGTYGFNLDQRDENKPQLVKRSLINRTYLLDRYTPTTNLKIYQKTQQTNELQFMKNHKHSQIIEIKQKNSKAVKDILASYKLKKSAEVQKIEQSLNQYKRNHQKKMSEYKKQAETVKNDFEFKKEKQIQIFEKKLLKIIERSNQLTNTRDTEKKRLALIKKELIEKNSQILMFLRKQKQQKLTTLVQKFTKLISEVQQDKNKMQSIDQDFDEQQKIFNKMINDELQHQFQTEQDKRLLLNSQIAKKQKDISNFNLRSKHLQNLIVQTVKQINRLQQDKKQYNQKTKQMAKELKNKENFINKKQQELKKLSHQTKNLKSFKDLHEYMLNQFNQEIQPNELKNMELQVKVKQMNEQLLKQIEWRHHAEQKMQLAHAKIVELKQNKLKKLIQKQTFKNSIQQIAYSINNLLKRVSPDDWRFHLKMILAQRFDKNEVLSKLSSELVQMVPEIKGSYEQQEIQLWRDINNLLKKKQQINKKIYKVNKSLKFEQKYKEQLFRKFQNENTVLVRQYNLLIKQKKNLEEQIGLLKQSMNYAEQYNQLRHQKSSMLLTDRRQLKPTPFQQYSIQQSMTARKQSSQRKTTAKLNPIGGTSTGWLKTLMKDIELSATKAQKFDIIKSRVKSFVNPQFNKIKIITPGQTVNMKNIKFEKKRNQIDIFNDITLQNRQIRTKSELLKTIKKQIPNKH